MKDDRPGKLAHPEGPERGKRRERLGGRGHAPEYE
jgi:hypothetical protein